MNAVIFSRKIDIAAVLLDYGHCVDILREIVVILRTGCKVINLGKKFNEHYEEVNYNVERLKKKVPFFKISRYALRLAQLKIMDIFIIPSIFQCHSACRSLKFDVILQYGTIISGSCKNHLSA